MFTFLLMFFEKLAILYIGASTLIFVLGCIIELLYPGDVYTDEEKQTPVNWFIMMIIVSLFWPLFIDAMYKGFTQNTH